MPYGHEDYPPCVNYHALKEAVEPATNTPFQKFHEVTDRESEIVQIANYCLKAIPDHELMMRAFNMIMEAYQL